MGIIILVNGRRTIFMETAIIALPVVKDIQADFKKGIKWVKAYTIT